MVFAAPQSLLQPQGAEPDLGDHVFGGVVAAVGRRVAPLDDVAGGNSLGDAVLFLGAVVGVRRGIGDLRREAPAATGYPAAQTRRPEVH